MPSSCYKAIVLWDQGALLMSPLNLPYSLKASSPNRDTQGVEASPYVFGGTQLSPEQPSLEFCAGFCEI